MPDRKGLFRTSRRLKTISPFFRLSQQAFTHLQANDPVRMAGATAFFTFFALPPIIILLTTALSPVLNQRRLTWRLFDQLAEVFGRQSADQLEAISENLQRQSTTWELLALSGAVLLLASTTLFSVIQNSLNQLWSVKAKPERRVAHLLKDRLVALGLILFSGLLFIVSIRLDRSLIQLNRYLVTDSFVYPAWVIGIGNFVLSVTVITVWFAILFKYLPDVKIRWRAVWIGALLTSVLFKLGELVLNRLLIQGPIGPLYGASGAVILLLLFVFYSALIFYFGAAFTRSYAEFSHLDSQPRSDAVGYEITELKKKRLK